MSENYVQEIIENEQSSTAIKEDFNFANEVLYPTPEPQKQYANVMKGTLDILESDFKWYTLRIFSGKDDEIQRAIIAEIKRQGIQDIVRDVVIPKENVYEIRNGKKREVSRSFLPGYILVYAAISEKKHTKNKILDTITNVNGVINFVGRKNDPVPIQQAEMERIFSRIIERNDPATIETTFQVGDPIKVIVGPFAGFGGSVSEISLEKRKIKVDIIILGRKTPVELDFEQIEFDKPE